MNLKNGRRIVAHEGGEDGEGPGHQVLTAGACYAERSYCVASATATTFGPWRLFPRGSKKIRRLAALGPLSVTQADAAT